MLLENKTAFVTGTNRGIGRAVLEVFAREGADVYAHARKKTPEHIEYCNILSKQYSVRIIPVFFDMTEYEDVKRTIKEILKKEKKIDVLVNNIGMISDVQLFQMTSIETMKNEFDVNFFSQMHLTQYISRAMMKQKRGSIINISSCAGIDGNLGMLQYVSSKAALIGATKRLAIELGEYNIRVNSIAPGLTDTEMSSYMSDELEEATLRHQIFKRKAAPEEIANGVLFFASELSGFITGQILRIDGGMLN